jgi:hypothetical protein
VRRLDRLFRSLDRAGVRYVLVGGVAVNLRGHLRMTIDTDLVVDLEPAAAARTVEVFLELGLQPRIPGDPRAFADPEIRRDWVENRNMKVFSWVDPEDPLRVIDVFVSHPIPFDELWARAELLPLQRASVRTASIPDLIRMKRLAGRPRDLEDIAALEAIQMGDGEVGDG